MDMPLRQTDGAGGEWSEATDGVSRMIEAMGSPNGLARQRARQSLVRQGRRVVPPLTEALSHPNWRLRWEAAKALVEIADPTAAKALVAAMEDDRPGVRWVAAEGVVALGHRGLVPLLKVLVRKSESAWFRLGAHHVLRALLGRGMDSYIVPVLRALDSVEPAVAVPLAAEEALIELARDSGEIP